MLRIIKHEKQGIGIQPDIFITETQKAIKEGRDEHLEKSMELLK